MKLVCIFSPCNISVTVVFTLLKQNIKISSLQLENSRFKSQPSHCQSVGDFTFWLRLSLSLNFSLSTYLDQSLAELTLLKSVRFAWKK